MQPYNAFAQTVHLSAMLPFLGVLLSKPCVVVPTAHAEDPDELSRLPSSSSITVPSLISELKSEKQESVVNSQS